MELHIERTSPPPWLRCGRLRIGAKRALGADRLGTGINGGELRGANEFENARRCDRDHMQSCLCLSGCLGPLLGAGRCRGFSRAGPDRRAREQEMVEVLGGRRLGDDEPVCDYPLETQDRAAVLYLRCSVCQGRFCDLRDGRQ